MELREVAIKIYLYFFIPDFVMIVTVWKLMISVSDGYQQHAFFNQIYTENESVLIFGGGLNNLKVSWDHLS